MPMHIASIILPKKTKKCKTQAINNGEAHITQAYQNAADSNNYLCTDLPELNWITLQDL